MAKSIKDIPKKRGRPATGKDPMLTFRSPPDLTAGIDAAVAREAGKPTRSEMIRRIVRGWLIERGLLAR
jgi:hypothetical protein